MVRRCRRGAAQLQAQTNHGAARLPAHLNRAANAISLPAHLFTTVRNTDNWLKHFAAPAADSRPMPLWVWNGAVTEARLTAMLEQFAAQHCGGVFIHPRPGLITEYLSERWFELWAFALRECDRLGLECHIYDENSFPSGFAGGHVAASDPGTIAETLIGQAAEGGGLEFVVQPAPPDPFHAGFGYVDLARPGTTALFLKTTHAEYARRFQREFGRRIKYAFADEPELYSRAGLAWSAHLAAEFQREHGYALADQLAVFAGTTESAFAVRFDYFWTAQRLFTENFLRPMHDWCTAHGLAFTGHFNEHVWPIPRDVPDIMAALRWMHVPGNDLLAFQFSPAARSANGLYLLNLTELRSVANQLGRDRVLCETGGGGGYSFTLADSKALEDFALANGVNLINPHLSYETLAGARKYDWPQTFSDHSPWWDAYRVQADHIARVVHALRQGREQNRILVLQPTTTAWLYYRPPSFTPGQNLDPAIEKLRQIQIDLVLALTGEHFDFDLGDELILAELGTVQAGQLRVGQRDYAVVVIPPGMENLLASTAALLQQFIQAGGTVLAAGALPTFVRGRRLADPTVLAGWEQCGATDQFLIRLRQLVPPRFTAPADWCVMRKELAAGEILYFIANPWDKAMRATVQLEGQTATLLDTRTGGLTALNAGSTGFDLDLPARGHSLLLLSPVAVPSAAAPNWQPVAVGPVRVERVDANVLVLDYCDLEVNGRTERSLATIAADLKNWQANGFPRNMWNFATQYKRTLLDTPIAATSGFKVRYRFCSPQLPLELAVERPWLYRITLNGRPVSFAAAVRWFDEDIRRVRITDLVTAGENVLELAAQPFQVLCEIMPVYLLGDFAVTPAGTGFVIEPPRDLTWGGWSAQGLSFYPWGVQYRLPIHLQQPGGQVAIVLPHWQGSVAHIRWDGQPRGVIAFPPGRLEWAEPVPAGDHELIVEVRGNLKNLLGPHFSDGLPGPWSWQAAPQPQPAGQQYKFTETGLREAPRCWVAN